MVWSYAERIIFTQISRPLLFDFRRRERGGLNAKFGLDFRQQSHIRKLIHVTGAYLIWLNTDLKISPIPPLILQGGGLKVQYFAYLRGG